MRPPFDHPARPVLELPDCDRIARVEDGRRLVLAAGCPLLPPAEAGTASLDEIRRRLETEDLDSVVAACDGVFGLFVFDKTTGVTSIATDRIGLYRIYENGRRVSTSFLSLFDEEPHGVAIDAAMEFLVIGYTHAPATLAAGIRRLAPDHILEIAPDGTLRIRQRRSVAPPPPPAADFFLEGFRERASLCTRLAPSLDLTGGLDSRLLACAADACGLDFETALSATAQSEDSRIARRVATALGRPLHLEAPPAGDFDREFLQSVTFFDGQIEAAATPRNRRLALARRRRGRQLVVHGGGGELLSDFPFAHAFPRYHGPVDLRRLYALRYVGIDLPPAVLTDAGRRSRDAVAARYLERWAPLAGSDQARACPLLYLRSKAPDFYGRFLSAYVNAGLACWAPFLEPWCALPAIGLPVRQKIFRLWHRRQITRLRPDIAAIETTDEGMSASIEPGALLADAPRFARHLARRGLRKLAQRVLGRSLFAKPGMSQWDPQDWRDWLRRSDAVATALDFLQSQGLFTSSATPEDFDASHIGRLATLGHLLQRRS